MTVALLLGWVAVALAQPADEPASREVPATAPSPPAPSPKGGVDRLDPSGSLGDEARLRVFEQARRRGEEMAKAEAELARREARLKGLQSDVEARYKALRLLQEELSASIEAKDTVPEADRGAKAAEAEKSRAEDVRRLSRVFEKMKPEEAARVVPQMDEGLVVDVLLRIKDRQAGKILGGLDPGLAARLSEKMAQLEKVPKDKPPGDQR